MGLSTPTIPPSPSATTKRFLATLGDYGTDRHQIQKLRQRFDFPKVADAFRMIDDATMSVVITSYGPDNERDRVERLVDDLERGAPPTRRIMRQLQPFVVAVRWNEATRYERQGLISPILTGLGHWRGDYSDQVGLTGRDLDAEALVI